MATKPPEVPFRPLFAGDRATAPGALEETGDSAWQQFEELREKQDRHFAATEPGQRIPGPSSRAFLATQPMTIQPGVSRKPVTPRAKPALSLDEVMLVARKNNRACPVPDSWQALHDTLSAQARPGPRFEQVPVPIDGPAWNVVSPMQKRLRLRDQIEWAESAGALATVYQFLLALPEEHWLHF